MTKKKGKHESHFIFDIISEGQTEITDPVAEEMEFLRMNYDGVTITEQKGFYPKVSLTMDVESNPKRRITLEVHIVAGYPFVAPKVQIILANGVQPGEHGALMEAELKQIQIDVKESISHYLVLGAPCIMQIFAAVEKILIHGIQRSCTPAPEKTVEIVTAVPKAESSLKEKNNMRLNILLLHLLNKCCHLKDPDSNEEASSNYQLLLQYLIHEVKLIPPKLQKCIPWKYDYVQRAFGENIQNSMEDSAKITKWVWSQEKGIGTFERSSPGRFKDEFIQQYKLGEGGFAPVFVCRKKLDGIVYAVKKILIKRYQRTKVLREVKSLASLNHKNIVRYYDAWIEPGCDEDLIDYLNPSEEEEEEEENDNDKEDEDEENSSLGSEYRKRKKAIRCINIDSSSITSVSENEEEETDASDSDYYDNSSDDEDSQDGMLKTPKITCSSQYDTLYIQMELCSKQTLRDFIDKCDKEPNTLLSSGDGEKIAASIFRQLLAVVAHFHRKKIVHRDLKPANILFEVESSINGSEIETIRVADFGLARKLRPSFMRAASSFEVDDIKMSGELDQVYSATGNLGSVLYCAPEQKNGENYNFKVDEYSLGMIALEMWLAVNGKGFRERFNIMTEISRGNSIPEWFRIQNPKMFEIISSLLEIDPTARKSCDDILNTADLPGDPADIVEALKTIEKYGESITGRIIRSVQNILVEQCFKSSSKNQEGEEESNESIIVELARFINIIGILHHSVFVSCYDLMIPRNFLPEDLEISCIIDGNSRVCVFSSEPHLAIAYFYKLSSAKANKDKSTSAIAYKEKSSSNSHMRSFYQFYYKIRPYVVFTTPCSTSGGFEEKSLEPILSFLHLISVCELKSKLDIIISHANWLNAIHPINSGLKKLSSDELIKMSQIIEKKDCIRSCVFNIENILTNSGFIQTSMEREELIENYTSILIDILPLFGEQTSSNIRIIIDSSLKPSETSVNRSFLEDGLILECRTRTTTTREEEFKAVAFCCNLENFINRSSTENSVLSAISLSIDLQELGSVVKYIRFPQKEPLIFRGVGVLRNYVSSLTQITSVVEVAVKLWLNNIRACLGSKTHKEFSDIMIKEGMQAIYLDGNLIKNSSSFPPNKGKISGLENVTPEELCDILRDRYTSEQIHNCSSTDPVIYLGVEKKESLEDSAVAIFEKLQRSLSHILVVDSDFKTIWEIIKELIENSNLSKGGDNKRSELVKWFKENMSKYKVIPIFSKSDNSVTFFVDPNQFKRKTRNDVPKRKKGSK